MFRDLGRKSYSLLGIPLALLGLAVYMLIHAFTLKGAVCFLCKLVSIVMISGSIIWIIVTIQSFTRRLKI